jgi:hypothetical protein
VGEQVGDAMREDPGLARAGSGDNEQRRAGVLDRRTLLWVEPSEQVLWSG